MRTAQVLVALAPCEQVHCTSGVWQNWHTAAATAHGSLQGFFRIAHRSPQWPPDAAAHRASSRASDTGASGNARGPKKCSSPAY
eukprot:2002545-Prymnesium_polylepis.1